MITATEISKIAGKKIVNVKTFKNNDDFDAYNKAVDELRNEGYQVGSMCSDDPIGFADNADIKYIAKWKNISSDEYPKLDGVIVSEDFRCNGCIVVYFK